MAEEIVTIDPTEVGDTTATAHGDDTGFVSAEEVVGEEWAEWYRLAPAERWRESGRLWQTYLALGGSLDPEPDTQSPFYDPDASDTRASDGRTGMHIVWRGGI